MARHPSSVSLSIGTREEIPLKRLTTGERIIKGGGHTPTLHYGAGMPIRRMPM